jgi:hypothetical protein
MLQRIVNLVLLQFFARKVVRHGQLS